MVVVFVVEKREREGEGEGERENGGGLGEETALLDARPGQKTGEEGRAGAD